MEAEGVEHFGQICGHPPFSRNSSNLAPKVLAPFFQIRGIPRILDICLGFLTQRAAANGKNMSTSESLALPFRLVIGEVRVVAEGKSEMLLILRSLLFGKEQQRGGSSRKPRRRHHMPILWSPPVQQKRDVVVRAAHLHAG
jgi:hypothetical protein